MAKDFFNLAAEIQKEYGPITFKDPRIRFDQQCISVRQHMSISQMIYVALGLLSIIVVFIWFHFPISYLLLSISLPLAGIIYEYWNHFNVKEIDFAHKEIRIRNRLPFVNLIRRKMNKRSRVPFHDISHFMTDDTRFTISLPRAGYMKERRTELKVKFFDYAPLVIGSFRFEREARRLGELLQIHIIGKAKFND